MAHDLLLLALAAGLFWLQYRAIIAAEEEFLRARFGAEYDTYCARVPRFWPRAARVQASRPWDVRRAIRKEHNPAASWIALAIVLVASDRVRESLRPYAIALGIVLLLWLWVKAWKHRWFHGNFVNDFRRRLRETAR